MRHFLGNLGRFWISRFGSPIRDVETGELLGRAILVAWRGKVHLIGFTGTIPLKPMFTPQNATRYWRQSLGFTRPTDPDFPRNRPK